MNITHLFLLAVSGFPAQGRTDEASLNPNKDDSDPRSFLGIHGRNQKIAWASVRNLDAAPLANDAMHGTSRKPIIWFHLHKQGGTFMCKKAIENGEHVPPVWNCDMSPDRVDRMEEDELHCTDRIATNYSFSAIERWATEEDLACPENAIYGVMLRDPVQAAMSYMMYHHFTQDEKDHFIESSLDSTKHVSLWTESPGDPHWDKFQHISNFATRSLAGGFAKYNAKKLTEDHLTAAKETLNRMHVVLILDELASHRTQLTEVFKWTTGTSEYDLTQKTEGPGGREPDNNEKAAYYSPRNVEMLESLNTMDVKLFEYAKELARKRSDAFNSVN